MAKHATGIKRIPIKWVRDRAKGAYKKGTSCAICGTSESLDFHHYFTLTPLFERWCKSKKYPISSDEEVLAIRDEFISAHLVELYEETVTLCHSHHMKLHSVYGKDPSLASADKQKRWVSKQREKYEIKSMAE